MNIFWFRRDLRLHDNVGLSAALRAGDVQPVFIFDTNILDQLESDDTRISFIHSTLTSINAELSQYGSALKTYRGDPIEIWSQIIAEEDVEAVYYNRDYEPYAVQRDTAIETMMAKKNIPIWNFKDQVIFEGHEIGKADGQPYTVFTPYKNKWLSLFSGVEILDNTKYFQYFAACSDELPTLEKLGFIRSNIQVNSYRFDGLEDYHLFRDYPAKARTSHLSVHLRFGTISVRECVQNAVFINETFLSELIWREFFMQILFHFPHVVTTSFKPKYEEISWRNNKVEFEAWCKGETGYPLVDAGMRQLNATGYMHNRVRMVTASFLVKHLLIDWRWGESYFAKKLVDFDLAANNGNWQWAAGTGCDAAPYFRIFNPTTQLKKFDPELKYTKTWVSDLDEPGYAKPIVEHKFARERCLATYKSGIK